MELTLKGFQYDFIESEKRFPALVAGIGTGKTMSAIFKMQKLMKKYPKNLGIVIRREWTDLRDSTIKDFERYTGMSVGSNKDAEFSNGSLIMFRHGDEINVLKNINAGAVFIEQAEEFDTDETFTFLRDRLRRQEAGIRQLFIIANTNGHNWIWNNWKIGKDPDFDLYEATTFDNEDNLPKDFISDLLKMKDTHPHHFNRYVMNSWEDIDIQDQIIKYEWIQAAVGRSLTDTEKSVVICDPARYGDDETVIYVINGAGIKDYLIYRGKSTMETAGAMIGLFHKYNAWSMGIDVIGLGSGIADRIKELGFECYEINSASASEDTKKYKNLRAEMWAKAADKFFTQRVSLPKDDILTEQLSAVKYKAIESNGRLQVESKEDIKKRLNCSPDRADCYVMGLWLYDKTSINVNEDYPVVEQHATQRRAY